MKTDAHLSWGCSSHLKTAAPITRYRTTKRKMAVTVFHFITVATTCNTSAGQSDLSNSLKWLQSGLFLLSFGWFLTSPSSRGVSVIGLVEKERRGFVLWVADFGSNKSGAATVEKTGLLFKSPVPLYIFPLILHHPFPFLLTNIGLFALIKFIYTYRPYWVDIV